MKNFWWIVGIVLVVALLASGRFLNPKTPLATPEESTAILNVVADDYIKGSQTPTVTLIEYLDFECEACRAYYPVIKQLQKEFPNDLRVVTRYFPLPGHRNSMNAALAAEAAARQGKYWEMHDLLFETQEVWGNKQMPNPRVFEAYAEQIGLDLVRYTADVADPTVQARVDRDFTASEKLGNQSTPSLFLNGKKVSPRGYEDFKQLIQSEIDAAPKQS